MYSLAACAHYALSNVEPLMGVAPRPIRSLTPAVSSGCEAIVQRALHEKRQSRYQRYQDMQGDLRYLLP